MRVSIPYIIALSLLTLLVWTSCFELDYEPVAFLTVETMETTDVKATSAVLLGRIHNPDDAEVEAFGFCWSLSTEEPTIEDNVLGGSPINEDFFEASLVGLAPATVFNVRAFARIAGDDRTFYGAARGIRTDGIALIQEDVLKLESGRATIVGRVFGLEENLSVYAHGFCWSDAEALPTIADDTTNLGRRFEDDIFVDTLTDLANGVQYSVRPYAIYQLDTPVVAYGSPQSLRIDDIWELRGSFPDRKSRQLASAFVIDRQVYVTGGIQVQLDETLVYNDLFRYDTGTGEWLVLGLQFAESINRYAAVSFAIGNKGYLGTGLLKNGTVLTDFFVHDPQAQTTDRLAVPPEFAGRHGALAFVIDQQAYIGLGIDANGQALRDFWRFDPSDAENPWTELPPFEGVARGYASAFVIGGTAYIGTGRDNGGRYLRDMWAFDPGGEGWRPLRDFPGPERAFAVAAALNDKGYLGTGSNEKSSALSDFWEYDLQTDTWSSRADLQGGPRTGALSFVLGDRVYVGAGKAGAFGLTAYFRDWWSYVPE